MDGRGAAGAVFPGRDGLRLAHNVVCAHGEVVLLHIGRIPAGGGGSLRAAVGGGIGGTVAGAGISSGPRFIICAGVFAGGAASERAVSRPGKPEGTVCLPAATALGGRGGRRHGPKRQNKTYGKDGYYPQLADAAAVFCVAGAALLRLPGQAGRNSASKIAGPHATQAARKRRSSF